MLLLLTAFHVNCLHFELLYIKMKFARGVLMGGHRRMEGGIRTSATDQQTKQLPEAAYFTTLFFSFMLSIQ
jgi:hypothetical protein